MGILEKQKGTDEVMIGEEGGRDLICQTPAWKAMERNSDFGDIK